MTSTINELERKNEREERKMYPYPNFEACHKKIKLYLDICELSVRGGLLCSPATASWFFSEMIFRAISRGFQKSHLLGPGDLTNLGMDLIQDFNAGAVTFGSQQTVKVRYFQSSGLTTLNLEGAFKKRMPKKEFEMHGKDLIWQAIQEQAGLVLLNLYLRGGGVLGVSPTMSLFQPLNLPSWLRMAVRLDYNGPKGKDWKSMRCLFYRYLTYCGFIQVNRDCRIIKNSIPPQKILARLANRLIHLTKMKEYWPETGLTEDIKEVLNPEQIAEHFLRFNKVIE